MLLNNCVGSIIRVDSDCFCFFLYLEQHLSVWFLNTNTIHMLYFMKQITDVARGRFDAAEQKLCQTPHVDTRLFRHTYAPSSWFLYHINPHQPLRWWKDNAHCTVGSCVPAKPEAVPIKNYSSCYRSLHPLSPSAFLWYAHRNTPLFCFPHFKSRCRKML